MIAIFVKGDWFRRMVQPNLIFRYIHRNELGVVDSYNEDKDYNVVFYIKNCNEKCLEVLKEEFPQYEFTYIS